MWTIQMLGGLAAHSPHREVTRFRTQKAASLLAFLAFHPAPQPRETLLDLLWPDADIDTGRHNLSNALSFLRHQLEPPGVPPGTVILADRASVRLNPQAVSTDVAAFETALEQANRPGLSESARLSFLEQAVQQYQGTLLPGFYEEWVAAESLRLESLFGQVVAQLVPELLEAGQPQSALTYAQRAVIVDPLSEETVLGLMQALVASGQSGQALRAYRAYTQRLKEQLDEDPSQALQQLAGQLGQRASLRTTPVAPDDGVPSEESFPLPLPGPHRPEPEATAVVSATIGAVPRGRLLGGEFLLRTTTHFFGREEEIERLGKMLSTPRTRLVTLTGPGGTGKTRLALEVAAHLAEKTEDTPPAEAPTSAVFVPLAPVTEAERLFDVTLRSLGIVPASNQEPLDQLANALASRPSTLLVLDNFEQLVEEGALRVHDLLGKSAGVKVLVTSRQKLQIEGEHEFHLSPLPTSAGTQTPEELLGVPSIALFVDRAQTALPDFQLTERNAAIISQLCDRLEGIPLAIELAAARVAVLTPARILEQVQTNRLDFLATRRRDAESRQRTLRATLDWSYQLLPEAGQQFLAQMSVFRGGWTLEAAQEVCQSNEEETLEMLTLLRDGSLLGVTDTEQGLRFTMLETIQEYSQEKLLKWGEDSAVRCRHRDYFVVYAEQAEPELTRPDQAMWLDCLEIEHENLRAALTWSLRLSEESRRTGEGKATEAEPRPPASVPLRFCAALRQFWSTRGHLREGRAWCDAALKAQGAREQTSVRGKALNTAGELAWLQGDYDASRAYHTESLSIFRQIGDRRDMADSLNNLGVVAHAQGDYAAARTYYEEALSIFRQIGDQRGMASALNNRGRVANLQGDYAAARTYYEEALIIRRQIGNRRGIALSLSSLGVVAVQQSDYAAARAYHEEALVIQRQIGDRLGMATSLNNLGHVVIDQGDYAAARTYYEEALVIQRQIGDRDGIALSLNNLGVVVLDLGDYAAARTCYEEALSIFRQIGDQRGMARSLNNLGQVVLDQGDDGIAKTLIEESVAIRRELGDKWGLTYSLTNLGMVARARGDHGVARKLFEESLEIRRELGDKRGIAISLDCFANLAASEGQLAQTARLWGAAEALREAIGAPIPPGERGRYEDRVVTDREELGETAFAAAWEEGRALTLEQAVAYALQSD